MGTSILQQIQQRRDSSRRSTSILEELRQRKSPTETYDANVPEEDPFFLTKIFDFGKYITDPTRYFQRGPGIRETVSAFATGAQRSVSELKDQINERGFGSFLFEKGKESVEGLKEIATNNPLDTLNSFANGMFDFFIETPFEAATGFKNIAGSAIPMTPDERTYAVQQSIAAFANLATQRYVAGALLKAPTGVETLRKTSKLGNLAKVAVANTAAEGAAAALTEPFAQLGQEDYAQKVVSNLLTSVTAGGVLGTLFDYPRYNKELKANRVAFTNKMDAIVNARASANYLHNNELKSPQDIVASVEAVLKSDTILDAAIRSGLYTNGFVVPSLSTAEGAELLARLGSAPPLGVVDYRLPPNLASKLRPTYSGIPIEWKNDFDLVAYHAQAKGFQKHPELMQDVMNKYNITKDQLIAHGKYVKSKLKEMEAAGMFAELTQGDIEKIEQEFAEKGKEFLESTRHGQTFPDFTGREWTRDEDTIVSGNLRVPIDGATNYMAFGRTRGSVNPAGNRKLILPAQTFYGDFLRNAEGIDITYGPRGQAFVHSQPLTIEAREMFQSTGYLPKQKVDVAGLGDGYIVGYSPKIQKLLKEAENATTYTKAFKAREAFEAAIAQDPTVKVKVWDANTKRWDTHSVTYDKLTPIHTQGVASEFVFENKAKSLAVNQLEPETYAREFIARVKDLFENEVILKAGKPNVEIPTFEDLFQRAGRDLNIPTVTLNQLRTPIYSIIGDDLVSRVLSPEDAKIYQYMQNGMALASIKEELNQAGFFRQLVDRNGYYVVEHGSNMEIREITTNKLIHVTGSLKDGINFLARSGRSPLPVFDGVVPADFVRMGNLSTEVAIHDTKLSELFDGVNTTALGLNFTPIRDLWASISNNIDRLGINSRGLFKKVEAINDSLMKRRMFFAEHKPMMELYKSILKKADGLSAVQLDHINRYMQTMTPDEIMKSYLARPMTQVETQFASQFQQALTTAGQTVALIDNAYIAGAKAGKVGSVEFNTAVSKIFSEAGIDPALYKQMIDFTTLMTMHGTDVFSAHAVLKLTHALQFPGEALSSADYAKTRGMTAQAVEVAEGLKELFKQAGDAAGIPDAARIGAYLPQIKEVDSFNAYHDIPLPEGFAREMNRVLVERQDLVKNPLSLAFSYIHATANEYAGISKAVSELSRELYDDDGLLIKLRDGVHGEQGLKQAKAAEALFVRYKDGILGYPDLSDKMRAASRGVFSRLLGRDIKGYGTGSMVALIDSAYIGARPIQGIRDILTSIGVTYQLFGSEFMGKALYDSIKFSAKDLELLEADLKIPRTIAQDFLAPDTDFATGAAIGVNKGINTRMQEIGLAISGQHAVYIRTLAGIYKHTSDLVYDFLGQAKRQEITLEEAVDALHVRVHNPAVQRQFLAYANAGDIDGAARFLGKWNGKMVANNYGEMQSPVTWRKGIGRVLGQFGSWGANMMQTQMNSVREFGSGGDWKGALGRTARLAAYTGALMVVGNELGIDLKNVMFTPIQAAPGLGPLGTMYDELRDSLNTGVFDPDESIAKRGRDTIGRYLVPFYNGPTDIGKFYIHWSYQMRDILRATEAWNAGNDPFDVAMKALGVKQIPQ